MPTSGRLLREPSDLMGILTNLSEGDVLFIDEIHRLPTHVEEILCPAMEDFAVDFVIDKGLQVRTLKYSLRPITIVGGVDKEREVSSRLRALFVAIPLQPYVESELSELAQTLARAQGTTLSPDAARVVARASGGDLQRFKQMMRFLAKTGGNLTGDEVGKVLSKLGYSVVPTHVSMTSADLGRLAGTEFEALMNSLLQRLGFRTELTQATGDGGIDIVAFLDRPFAGGRFLIQCKRFAPETPVGAPVVREFYGAVAADRNAVKGILITTSTFTAQAQEFARGTRIDLIDGDQLNALLRENSLLRE